MNLLVRTGFFRLKLKYYTAQGSDGMTSLADHFRSSPVIAGVRGEEDLEAAIKAGVQTVFFLQGSLFTLRDMVAKTVDLGILTFSHVDLMTGIAKDAEGMRFLAEEVGLDGIVTTRTHLIRAAKDVKLLTIQRIFLLDSESLRTGFQVVSNSEPDAVEVLPALVVPYVTEVIGKEIRVPIIAGGLISTEEELKRVLQPPVVAVSTSRKELWGSSSYR